MQHSSAEWCSAQQRQQRQQQTVLCAQRDLVIDFRLICGREISKTLLLRGNAVRSDETVMQVNNLLHLTLRVF